MRNCGSESCVEKAAVRGAGGSSGQGGREEVETGARCEGEGDISRAVQASKSDEDAETGPERERRREIGGRGQEKINRPANMC